MGKSALFTHPIAHSSLTRVWKTNLLVMMLPATNKDVMELTPRKVYGAVFANYSVLYSMVYSDCRTRSYTTNNCPNPSTPSGS